MLWIIELTNENSIAAKLEDKVSREDIEKTAPLYYDAFLRN